MNPPGSPPSSDGYRNSARAVLSWALYDFANTIYSAVVVTAFIAKYVQDCGGSDVHTAIANIVSMMAAGLLGPLLGAWSDRSGLTKRALAASTLVCCSACVAIALAAGRDVLAVLAFFAVANVSYQASLVFYDSLLPTVATPDRIGRLSGFGVALGSLGMALAVLPAFAIAKRWGMEAAFLFAGAGFLVFALPLFVFVRERPPAAEADVSPVRGAWRALAGLRETPALGLFLLGNFLCFDALNATILFYRPFLEKGAHFPEDGVKYTLLASSLLVVPLGLAQGWLSDRIPPRRVYLGACGAFLLAILVCGFGEGRWLIGVTLAFCGAAALSGLQATGRKILVSLAPPDRVGTYFGLYELTARLSGWQSLLFALAAEAIGYRRAVLILLVTVIPGMILVMSAKGGGQGEMRKEKGERRNGG